MTIWTRTTVGAAFDDLVSRVIEIDAAWTCALERSGMFYAFGDMRHHLCMAIAQLDMLVPGDATYPTADDGTRVLMREAYLSVIALGQLLRSAADERWCAADTLAAGHAAIARLLDELAPYVSRADIGLRRVLLDGEPLERVLAEPAP